jgi:hypothetical protein
MAGLTNRWSADAWLPGWSSLAGDPFEVPAGGSRLSGCARVGHWGLSLGGRLAGKEAGMAGCSRGH